VWALSSTLDWGFLLFQAKERERGWGARGNIKKHGTDSDQTLIGRIAGLEPEGGKGNRTQNQITNPGRVGR